MIHIGTFLQESQINFQKREEIHILFCSSSDEANDVAKKVIDQVVDRKTALFLSGGKTPRLLYEQLATDMEFVPGAVGMVDERFGEKFNMHSNELMMQETGLLRSLSLRNIPFYPILNGDDDRETTADEYDQTVRMLSARYPKSVGLLGVGTDGHTSSIIPSRSDFTNPFFATKFQHMLVGDFDDEHGPYKERIGMTFLGLSMLDLLVVFALGADKRVALEGMFTDGEEEQIPARFFRRPDIAKKTFIITDNDIRTI